MPDPPIIENVHNPNEVSWQSAYGALVPLALIAMTQPGGRVCGFHPRLRTYLRSSPIFCLFDSIALVLRVCFQAISDQSFPLGLQKVLMERFEGAEEFGGGLQDLERLPFIRFVFVTLPAIVQAIKLFECKDYHGHIASINRRRTTSRQTPTLSLRGQQPQSTYSRAFGKFENLLGYAAILLQFFAFAWYPVAGGGDWPVEGHRTNALVFAYFFPPLMIAYASGGILVMLSVLAPIVSSFFVLIFFILFINKRTKIWGNVWVATIFLLVLIICAANWWLIRLICRDDHVINILYFPQTFKLWIRSCRAVWLVLQMSLFAALAMVTQALTGHFRQHVLLVVKKRTSSQDFFDYDMAEVAYAAICLAFFLSNLVFGAAIYAWYYNPRGTTKPTWAEWLG